MSDERWAWVALSLVPGGASEKVRSLAVHLGSAAELFRRASRHEPLTGEPKLDEALRAFDWQRAVGEQLERADKSGARLVLHGEEGYPQHLAPIPAPPAFLFTRGEYTRADAVAVAVVGSRRPTPYGARVSEQLARDLASRGVTIVSGFARGIDTAAHQGALAAGGRTVSVLGSGVDIIYPPENRRMVDQVLHQGALISQFPMGTAPLRVNFPIRNRTISGMTLGTVVVEAAEKSGALITAGFAGELGREVFAVPGNITSGVSQGTNRLIQDGAKLVRTWEDVVTELPEIWRRCLREPHEAESVTAAPEGEEATVLTLLGDEPIAIDQLIRVSGYSSSRIAALLLQLELKGMVRKVQGQCYTKARWGTRS